jgi:hypothetical protein
MWLHQDATPWRRKLNRTIIVAAISLLVLAFLVS